MPANDTQISKFMSYVLRHAPHELGLTLSDDGWADYAEFSTKQGSAFFVADNGVWLTDKVPPAHLSLVSEIDR